MSDLRMYAYYYGFDRTGEEAIDRVLSAVACAGKSFHHTESWAEESEPYAGHSGNSPVEWIQNAANAAAAEIARLRAALERLEALEAGEVSDGYHTHRELYEYRMLYNAHAVRGWLAAGIPVVKSWKHSDGEPCFGGGWFIVTAELPTGQVSNHYAAEHWHLFDVPEVDLPPEYDGHTPADAAERLRAALATPAPAPQQGGR